jgi:hypothetical protein
MMNIVSGVNSITCIALHSLCVGKYFVNMSMLFDWICPGSNRLRMSRLKYGVISALADGRPGQPLFIGSASRPNGRMSFNGKSLLTLPVNPLIGPVRLYIMRAQAFRRWTSA